MHLFYQLLSYVVFGALWPVLLLHPKIRRGIKRRLGFFDVPERPWPASRSVEGPRVWFHGASAGDLLALFPVVKQIRDARPDATLIVSTMTNSGYAIAETKLMPIVDAITYVPYDFPGSTRRTVEVLRPDVLVLEYAELWPNLIHACRRGGARVALTNGRLSESLVRRYRLLNAVAGNQLGKLDLMMMREPVEAERALALGAPPSRVKVTGNTKFDNLPQAPDDAAIDDLKQRLGVDDRHVLVAGSTHEGEEKSILGAFSGMREVDPTVRLFIAPRYIERASKIEALARAEGFTVALRSAADRDPKAVAAADVLVLDTMGELSRVYGLATLVFVGGSFVPRGGQNILEPAGQGRPVLFGPYMMNFRDSVEILLGRGGIQVQTPAQLEKIGRELLSRPDEIERLGVMARTAVQKARGASAKNAEMILALPTKRDRSQPS
ncbi:MAG: 3-deoxy-D-manno-octulosonic acid transferase [Deltaproteobacteria bacterium]